MIDQIDRPHSNLGTQMKGYRLATAEILYHMPDHPALLQSFIWQHYDLAPRFPELQKFLDFWVANIDGALHSVHVARREIISPGQARHANGWFRLH